MVPDDTEADGKTNVPYRSKTLQPDAMTTLQRHVREFFWICAALVRLWSARNRWPSPRRLKISDHFRNCVLFACSLVHTTFSSMASEVRITHQPG